MTWPFGCQLFPPNRRLIWAVSRRVRQQHISHKSTRGGSSVKPSLRSQLEGIWESSSSASLVDLAGIRMFCSMAMGSIKVFISINFAPLCVALSFAPVDSNSRRCRFYRNLNLTHLVSLRYSTSSGWAYISDIWVPRR